MLNILVVTILLLIRENSVSSAIEAPIPFGNERLNDFFLCSKWNNISSNHGAYGSTPKIVVQSQYEYVEQMESSIVCEMDEWMNYNRDLAQYGGQYLTHLWETKVLSPENMQSAMTNVQVPTNNFTICQMVVGQLDNSYNTMVSAASNIAPEFGNIPCYLRLSAQIYQEQNDWHILGALIVKLLKQLNGYVPGMNRLKF